MTTSLKQQIEEVKNSAMSYNKKRESIIKLGIMPSEVTLILGKRPAPLTHRDIFKFTFGVELETVGVNRGQAMAMARVKGMLLESQSYNHIDNNRGVYKFVTDGSLNGENPIECVSPVLASDKSGFDSLKTACDVINSCGGGVNVSCGTHVHIGCTGMTDAWYANVFVNYMYLEGLIDSFMARSRRGNDCNWCRSLTSKKSALLAARTISDVKRALNNDRYHKVNAEAWHRHNTIEFRQHQGTTDFEKIQNWVKFVGKLVGWSKTHRLNSEVATIEELPFLTPAEKNFFKARIEHFNPTAAAV